MNHCDLPNNVLIEFCQFLGRNPVFLMLRSTYRLDLVSQKKLGPYFKTCYIAYPWIAGFRVPVSGDFYCILLSKYWVENWLFRKSRRQFSEIALLD